MQLTCNQQNAVRFRVGAPFYKDITMFTAIKRFFHNTFGQCIFGVKTRAVADVPVEIAFKQKCIKPYCNHELVHAPETDILEYRELIAKKLGNDRRMNIVTKDTPKRVAVLVKK